MVSERNGLTVFQKGLFLPTLFIFKNEKYSVLAFHRTDTFISLFLKLEPVLIFFAFLNVLCIAIALEISVFIMAYD